MSSRIFLRRFTEATAVRAAPTPPVDAQPVAEESGLTVKEAWWAGYRAGKGLPPDTPRQEAIAAPAPAPAPAAVGDERCPDGLLPDGELCPRCGGRRGPSGVDGGSWVHYARPAPAEASPASCAWDQCPHGAECVHADASPAGERPDMVRIARRNLRAFLSKASFAVEVDRHSAVECLDVLESALATQPPAEQIPVAIGSAYRDLVEAARQHPAYAEEMEYLKANQPEPAEQKPVAEIYYRQDGELDFRVLGVIPCAGTKLYAAPQPVGVSEAGGRG